MHAYKGSLAAIRDMPGVLQCVKLETECRKAASDPGVLARALEQLRDSLDRQLRAQRSRLDAQVADPGGANPDRSVHER